MFARSLDIQLVNVGIIVGVIPDRVKPGGFLREVPEPLGELLCPLGPALLGIGDSLIAPYLLDGRDDGEGLLLFLDGVLVEGDGTR
jgi:hypothetical protein